MSLEQFDLKYIPVLVDRLVPLWSPPVDDMDFRRLYVEAIIRQNGAENDMQFQMTENGELCSIVFASKKGEHNSAGTWWKKTFDGLPSDFQKPLSVSRNYLSSMDEKTYSYMNDDDIKLSLFVSTKSGFGKLILDEAKILFKNRGFKNMYLWTDCDCNVDWYMKNGYTLVEEGTFDAFSRKDEEYKTYIFKISL